MRSRPGLRRRLQLSVTGAVALALVILIAAFNVILGDRLARDADNALSARAAAALATLQLVGNRVRVAEAPDGGALDIQTWIFVGRHAIERPPSDPVTQRAAELLAGGPRRTVDVAPTHTRLYAVPVLARGLPVGTVVAAVSLRPYESTATTALIASFILGAVVLLIVTIAARLLISAALRPVADMTAQAEAWSEADSKRRFDLGPPRDELTQLAATLDRLLDRLARSLAHEQRFSAEVSHELRSPLASVIAEAQYALRHGGSAHEQRAGYERILASAQQMRRTLDTLLSAARLELQRPHGRGDASAAANSAAQACDALARERGIALTTHASGGSVPIGVDTDVAERVLVPLIENACRFGRSAVTVAVRRDGNAVEFSVQDDGPGVPERARERIFEPGFSADGDGRGAGLGLPLARRLARAAGGDVREAPNGGGGRFIARLPAG